MNLDLVKLFTSDLNWITISIAIIVIVISNILNTVITERIKAKKTPSSIVKDKTIRDLQELHPIFTSLKYYRDVVLPTCKIGGPVRTIVFKDCLKIYYDTCINECEQLLKQDITNDTFLNINKNIIISFRNNLEINLKKANIPDIVIKKFLDWNAKRHDYVITVVSDVNSSEIVDSVVEKEYLILSILKETAYFTLIDAEKTLKTLNGELSGTDYKGLIIEPLHK